MKKTEQKVVRFYADNPEHAKAWEHLKRRDSSQYSSAQDFIIKAIVNLGDKDGQKRDNPYLETREREEEFIRRITDGVMQKVAEQLPMVIAGYVLGIMEESSIIHKDQSSIMVVSETDEYEKTMDELHNSNLESENKIETDAAENDMLDLDNFF